MDFSDPQSGKSSCDRMAAVIKCNIRRHIDENNNVTNSKEFVEAARQTKHISIYASAMPHNESKTKKKIEWHGIKSFNNIEYFKSSELKQSQSSPTNVNSELEHIRVKCWCAWNIGIGKSFNWKNLHGVTLISPLNVTDNSSFTNNQWQEESRQDGQ